MEESYRASGEAAQRIREEARRLRADGYDAQTAGEMAEERVAIQTEGAPGRPTPVSQPIQPQPHP